MRSFTKYKFCSLFDSYYLTRGIALYRSLELYCNDFHLYIFTFDDKCTEILKESNLAHATLISLKEFENDDLLRVKHNRTIAEYCWTCTASTIWYSINKFNLDHCTYLDADILFFASPVEIFKEIGNKSIGITPHNFSSRLKSSEIYGKYCVQFAYFKNDNDGMNALEWWKNSCIEWCYAKLEDGKYGDQKYLNHFETLFNNVCVINHYGVGVAPWNISEYTIESINNVIIVNRNGRLNKKNPLIFYHYQGLKFSEGEKIIISESANVKMKASDLKFIYKPYINQLISIKNQIKGNPIKDKEIIFKRSIKKSIKLFLNINLVHCKTIMYLYYYFKKNRYNQPKNIGADVN